MLSKIKSYGLDGINGYEVQIEIDVSSGIPSIEMVGLPDTAIKESRERVKSAIKSSGFTFIPKKTIINFAPADIKKEGAMYDLPIAIGILSATGQITTESLSDTIIIGELSLYGEIRRVKGILPLIISARANNVKNIIIPYANKNEASYIDGINVYALSTLKEAVELVTNQLEIEPIKTKDINSALRASQYGEDFKYVKGQFSAKRALEIAAAGNHNIFLIGPPGGGKTMLARCLPSILPDLTVLEALEATKIHSINGSLDEKIGIIINRPFRTPHHTCSRIALTGGGNSAKPGEISLAHNGVLFLDEMLEYSRSTLEILRQPLESNVISISRALKSVEYPANFMLVASMNPCPCGNRGTSKECTCTPNQVSKYLSRLSGPLMDRIDLHIEVDNVTYDKLSDKNLAEDSKAIKERVNKARQLQLNRFRGTTVYSNARMSNQMISDYCKLDLKSETLMKTAFERMNLSARAYTRILKVARTIADLENSQNIESKHIAEAIGYRNLDKGL